MLQSDFYNLVIVAIDAAGNESRVPVSLVVDAIAPDNAINLSISPDTGVIGDFVTSSNSVVLSGLAEINSTISLKINGIFNAKIPVDLNGKWSGIIPLIKDGSYGGVNIGISRPQFAILKIFGPVFAFCEINLAVN